MAEVIEKQRKALAESIKEAQDREMQRIHRLATVKKKSDAEALRSRYELERRIDKEKIERLTNDFFTLKKCQEDNTFSTFVERRKEVQHNSHTSASECAPELLPNRFAGMEGRDAQVSYRFVSILNIF